MRTRFAPTPSGYLHLGNLVNARIVADLAQRHGGELALRIDQDDRDRCRPEYAAHVFTSLRALGITWSSGPASADEVAAVDMDARTERLRAELERLPFDHIFACTCTRSTLIERPCTCRERALAWVPGETTLRLHLPDDVTFVRDGQRQRLHDELGDPVLWRRDDLPAYHWATVIDDRDLGTTHVVRGVDLLASSALHRYLAALIDAPSLAQARFLHHGLVTDAHGGKLSKSAQPARVPPPLTDDALAEIGRISDELAAGMTELP